MRYREDLLEPGANLRTEPTAQPVRARFGHIFRRSHG